MFDQDLFTKNLALLTVSHPSLALKMTSLSSECEAFTSCLTAQGEENLCFQQTDQDYVLHSTEGAEQEAHNWFQKLNLENCDVLYIYGLGLGYLYKAVFSWLKADPNHSLVFLEDELSVIHFWLGTKKATPILEDLQVDIRDFSQARYDRSVIYSLAQDYMLRNTVLTALPSYQTHKFSTFAILQDLITFETAEQNILYREMAQFGLHFFNNFYRNLFQLPGSYLAQGLFGKFKNIPAIICGAGPSLVKQIPLLKELSQRALLFGPGSALNILSYHDVLPHFGVNIDPTEETFHRQIMNRAFETPIFYRNRIYHEALNAIHGPRLFISGETYQTSEWFESQLGLETPPLQGGYNVVHTALQIAHLLGCNPIIFVGMDLSFYPNQHYASGVERHPLFPQQIEKKTHLGSPIQVKDIKGEKVESYWPWIAEAQWTDFYSRNHPEINFINASEEGIGLFSIPNHSLAEVAETHLKKTFDLEKMTHEAIQQTKFGTVSRLQVETSLKHFYHSLKNCETSCQKIRQEIRQHQQTPSDFLTETIKQEENQLKKEKSFTYFLEQFNEFFLTFIQKDLRTLARMKENQKRTHRAYQLLEERYQFLTQAITIHLKLIEKALNENIGKEALFSTSLSEEKIKIKDLGLEQKIYYYPSGSLYSIQTYQNEQREGKHCYYFEDGTLKTELNYEKGHLNGVVRLYYPNSQLKRELHFHQSYREGIEKSWYENGQLFTEVHYHQNIAKKARVWFSDGTLGKDIIL